MTYKRVSDKSHVAHKGLKYLLAGPSQKSLLTTAFYCCGCGPHSCLLSENWPRTPEEKLVSNRFSPVCRTGHI